MGIDRTLQVRPGTFSGNSKVYSAGPEGLAAHVRTLQTIEASRFAIAGAATDFISDDSATIEPDTLVVFDFEDGAHDNMVTLVDAELGVPTGHLVTFSDAGTLPTGVVIDVDYFVIRVQGSGQAGTKDPQIFQLAESQLLAEQGVVLDIEADGSGVLGVLFQIALPPAPVSFDSLGDTNGVLASSVKVTCDTLLENLGSYMVLLNLIRADIGMDEPDDGTLSSATTPILADVTATANSTDDNAADFADMVGVYNHMNNAIVTLQQNINDVAAAVGKTEFIDSMTPQFGSENADGDIDALTVPGTSTGGAVATVELTVFDEALVTWGACVAHIGNRLSLETVSNQTAAALYDGHISPAATEIDQVLPGTRTSNR